MEMDTSAPPTPAEPVLIDAGPEVDQFAKLLDSCLSSKAPTDEKREQLLDLPRQYHRITIDRQRKLRPRASQNGDIDMMTEDKEDPDASEEEAQLHEKVSKEAQTWDLLSRVLPLRHAQPTSAARNKLERLKMAGRNNEDLSASLLGSFFQNDLVARERRAVLQWLQTSAASGPSIDDLTRDLQQSADRGEIVAHGWVHTRSAIKYKKTTTGWSHLLDRQPSSKTMETHQTSRGKPMVTQLDPDACSRQGRELQPQDAFFEQAIWLGCFEHLRRGSSLEEIRDWCSERTEAWRAISMSGVFLSTDDADIAECTSPASVALWRRMCYTLAQKGTSDKYEAAVYGLMSGDISTVEKVATTWEDYLFTHYNALLRAQIDNYILEKCPPAEAARMVQSFPTFNALQSYGEGKQVETKILHTLSQKPGPKDELTDPNKALQSAILSRGLDDYFLEQGRLLSLPSEQQTVAGYFRADDLDGLRILAHVWVIITVLAAFEDAAGSYVTSKMPPRWETESHIIAQYANFLRRANLEELIPTYCSIIPTKQRHMILSTNLIHEEDNSRRQSLLLLMQKAGIDTVQYVEDQTGYYFDKIVEAQPKHDGAALVFSCLGDGSSSARVGQGIKADFFGEDEDDVEPNHACLVRSIEWLKLVRASWPSVFSWGTAAYKTFLSNVDLRSARLLMKTVSFSSVISDCLDQPAEDDELFDLEFWSANIAGVEDAEVTPQDVMEKAHSFRELEALVIALDNLESISAFAEFATEIADK